MKVIRRIELLCVVFVVMTLFVRGSAAALLPMLESSYYDGFVFYDEGNLKGRIDFAVYDRDDPENMSEYAASGLTAFGEGRYVYAYQIFNDFSVSEQSVAYFAVLGINETLVDAIGAQEDPEAGIAPGEYYVDGDESKAAWEFNGDDGYVVAGDHSWFLVFSTELGPTKGDYEIRGPDILVPVPEPVGLILLGLGSVAILTRRKKPSC